MLTESEKQDSICTEKHRSKTGFPLNAFRIGKIDRNALKRVESQSLNTIEFF